MPALDPFGRMRFGSQPTFSWMVALPTASQLYHLRVALGWAEL
jgi:hypothetical protein